MTTNAHMTRRLRKLEAGMMDNETQAKFDEFERMLLTPGVTVDQVYDRWKQLEADHPADFKKFWDTRLIAFLQWINNVREIDGGVPAEADAEAVTPHSIIVRSIGKLPGAITGEEATAS